jgi:sigma-E factor negative regulatory protein RseB
MRRLLGLAPLLVAAAAAAGDRAPTPEAALARMAAAVRELDYTGTVTYAHDGRIETMHLVHRGGSVERGRLTTVSGARREVICEGRDVRVYLPDQRTVLVERGATTSALPKLPLADPARIAAHYRVEDLGAGREAGRSCRLIGIAPRDALRYGYRLCLDDASTLPLRTELLDENGSRAIESVVFANIEFPRRIADRELAPSDRAEGWDWRRRASAEGAAPPELAWIVAAPPGGFELTETLVADPGQHHLAYSDGLASVSVFIDPVAADGKGLEGAARIGAMQLFGRRVGDHQVTVVGEVPAATVRAFAAAVAPAVAAR